MNPDPQQPLTHDQVQAIIANAQIQVLSAMLLGLAIVFIAIASLCLVLGWKKTAYLFHAGFAVAVFFIPAPFTLYAGPAILILSIVGIIREFLYGPAKVSRPEPVSVEQVA
jgi:hypothetical protein